MKKFLVFCALCCGVILTACNTTKRLVDKGPSIRNGVTEAAQMLELATATNVPYTWFAGEGNGTIDWEGNRYSAKVRVRMLHDSVIWVQIQKFGFEVGRMLVTPDSAFFINRLEHSYAAYNTMEFFKKYNLPADFSMFSRVFTGGAYIPSMVTKSMVDTDQSLYLETSTGVNSRIWLDVSSSLYKSSVTDPFHHEWQAEYGDYKATNTGAMFPYRRGNTLIDGDESSVFDIEFTTIEINVPQEFPFSIPSHYDKM